MPFDVHRGAVVGFSIEFLDANGNLTLPSSASLSISYPALTGGTAVATVSLTRGRVFTGTWDSTIADLGLATVSITGAGQATPTTTILRLKYP